MILLVMDASKTVLGTPRQVVRPVQMFRLVTRKTPQNAARDDDYAGRAE